MTPLFDYFWPSFICGVLAGAVAGTIMWKRHLVGPKRKLAIGAGALTAISCAMIWSGPLGGADRFIAAAEAPIRQMLINYEMTQVSAHLRRAPLRRQIVYSGPADEFQRTELVHMAEGAPGIASATWNLKVRAIPIVVEGAAVALLGLLFGLFLAYLAELHRRNNEGWSW